MNAHVYLSSLKELRKNDIMRAFAKDLSAFWQQV